MEIRYNVTGERRKEMVEIISRIVGMKAVYKRMPTCAYAISNLIVSKEGTLVWDERTDSQMVEKIREKLEEAGFSTEMPQAVQEAAETAPEETAESNAEGVANGLQGANMGLTVELPRESFTSTALENLHKLVEAKETLIKKALAVEALPIEVSEERVSFPWFSETDGELAKAYSHFISAICDMARNQKRVTAKEKDTANEKYAFRCFLLRLGFIGAEYKAERKILLKNLTGSSAFKSGAKKEADSNEISE